MSGRRADPSPSHQPLGDEEDPAPSFSETAPETHTYTRSYGLAPHTLLSRTLLLHYDFLQSAQTALPAWL